MYYTLVYWVYPMKDYVGETGCHITFFLRNAGVFAFQLQSLGMAFFRYICLFHSGSVRKLHISLNVSCKDQIMKPCLCLQVLIRFHCMFNWSFSLKIFFQPDHFIHFSDVGKVDFSDQFSRTITVLCICIYVRAYSRARCVSWKRLLQFFLKSSWSLLLWQYLFKRCLYDYMDLIYNRKFKYSWCIHYILLFKGNQKFNRKNKNSDWTPSLY